MQTQQDCIGHIDEAPPVADTAAPDVRIEGALRCNAHVAPVLPLVVQQSLQCIVVAALRARPCHLCPSRLTHELGFIDLRGVTFPKLDDSKGLNYREHVVHYPVPPNI